MPQVRCVIFLLVVIIGGSELARSGTTLAAEPLHARIDQLVAQRALGTMAATADDGEFLRRVYLDLAGRIPSLGEAREFLADKAAEKRAKLIDRLLAGDEYPRRMSELFHVMLMERLGDHDEWTKYLCDSFAANKPWDQMTREMLCPNADDAAIRGAAFFYTKRLENYGQNPVDVPGLVRDVGRLFLGVDVQCAQCHDHLFIDDYKQADYQGLLAFVGHMSIRRDVTFPAVTESLVTKKVDFMSVFEGQPMAIGPRLPGGAEVEIPVLAKGEEFLIPPNKQTKAPGVPKFSPLKILAEQLPSADNPAFKRNIVNRLWWVMMGRGLIDPLDLHHSDNAPSHPELLELLADEFAAHQFDIKWLLRELALSDTYQRSSLLPDGAADVRLQSYRLALEKPLSAEQLLYSMLQATGEYDRVMADQKTLTELRGRFEKALANPPREPEVEIAPTVKAALFVLNDSQVLGWLEPRPGNLVERLSKLPDADAVADELYLSVLTRLPNDEERADVADYLEGNVDRREIACGHLAWALLASTEFGVNH